MNLDLGATLSELATTANKDLDEEDRRMVATSPGARGLALGSDDLRRRGKGTFHQIHSEP